MALDCSAATQAGGPQRGRRALTKQLSLHCFDALPQMQREYETEHSCIIKQQIDCMRNVCERALVYF